MAAVSGAGGFVGFVGARALPPALAALVPGVVRSVLAGGRLVAVGCACGADAAVVSAVLASGGAARLSVFAAFGPGGAGACAASSVSGVAAAAAAGASVAWLAGGPVSVPVAGRLAVRARRLVSSVAALVGFVAAPCPAGLVPSSSPAACWRGAGSGSWAALAFAVGLGLPVVVFAAPGVALPSWPGGAWAPAGAGVWAAGWRWAPAGQLPLF